MQGLTSIFSSPSEQAEMRAEMCGCLQNVHLHRALKSLNPGYLRSGSCVFQITPLEFTAYGQAHPASLGLKSAWCLEGSG